MRSAKSAGRIVGILLLVQMVGMTFAFASMMSGVGTDYLSKAAGIETTIRMSVILLFVNSAITLAMSLVAFPVIREYGLRMAIAMVAVATVWVALQAVDNAHLMSMLALSKAYIAGANHDVYDALGRSLYATRRSIHYAELLVIDVWFGLFYGVLFAFRLVPRWLGALGLFAVMLHIVGLPLALFAGYPLMTSLAYGLGISYLLFGVWLVTKGFHDPGRADRG